MKFNKSVIESAVVLTLTTALAITAVVSDTSFVRAKIGSTTSYSFDTASENNGVAGISEIIRTSMNLSDDNSNTVTVEKEDVSLVASGIDTNTSVTRADIQLTAEQTAWLDYLFADVVEKLNVRSGPSTDYEIVGRIGLNARATIIERGAEWTKIRSGNVEGYVCNQFCIFGVDALAYAESALTKNATATTDVNIRSQMSSESEILDTLASGSTITVSKETVAADGWTPVIVGDTVGYVESQYVTVDYSVDTALTVAEEEELEKQRKAEEMKKRQVAPPNKVYGSAIDASDEELRIMAALLMCEAGGSYEGMVAAGAVICNRVKSSSWPNSLFGVMYAANQFTPVWTGMLERQLERGVTDTAYAAARAALAGEDPTNGCIFFRSRGSGHSGYLIGDNVFFYVE